MKKITLILFISVSALLLSSCYSSNKLSHSTSTFVQCSIDISPVEMNKKGYKQAVERQKVLRKQRKSLLRQKKRDMYKIK